MLPPTRRWNRRRLIQWRDCAFKSDVEKLTTATRSLTTLPAADPCGNLPPMLLKKLGQRIAGLRKAQRLTQTELAKKIGCSVEFISLVERGVNAPSVAGLEKFAGVLKVAIADLFVFKRKQPPRKARPAKRA